MGPLGDCRSGSLQRFPGVGGGDPCFLKGAMGRRCRFARLCERGVPSSPPLFPGSSNGSGLRRSPLGRELCQTGGEPGAPLRLRRCCRGWPSSRLWKLFRSSSENARHEPEGVGDVGKALINEVCPRGSCPGCSCVCCVRYRCHSSAFLSGPAGKLSEVNAFPATAVETVPAKTRSAAVSRLPLT